MLFTRKNNIKANKGYVLFVTTILLFTASIGVAALSSYHLNEIRVSHNYKTFDLSKNDIENQNTQIVSYILVNHLFDESIVGNEKPIIEDKYKKYSVYFDETKILGSVVKDVTIPNTSIANLKVYLFKLGETNYSYYFHHEHNEYIIETNVSYSLSVGLRSGHKINSKIYKKGVM